MVRPCSSPVGVCEGLTGCRAENVLGRGGHAEQEDVAQHRVV